MAARSGRQVAAAGQSRTPHPPKGVEQHGSRRCMGACAQQPPPPTQPISPRKPDPPAAAAPKGSRRHAGLLDRADQSARQAAETAAHKRPGRCGESQGARRLPAVPALRPSRGVYGDHHCRVWQRCGIGRENKEGGEGGSPPPQRGWGIHSLGPRLTVARARHGNTSRQLRPRPRHANTASFPHRHQHPHPNIGAERTPKHRTPHPTEIRRT